MKSAYSLADMASDGIAVIDHLDLEQTHLLAMSMGMITQSEWLQIIKIDLNLMCLLPQWLSHQTCKNSTKRRIKKIDRG